MIGLPYCKNYKFADMEKGARVKCGMTHKFLADRELLFRKAYKSLKRKHLEKAFEE